MIHEDNVKTGVNESDIELSSDDNEVGILISIFCHDVQLLKKSCLVDVSAYLWVQTVLFSPICFFICYEAGFRQGILK